MKTDIKSDKLENAVKMKLVAKIFVVSGNKLDYNLMFSVG